MPIEFHWVDSERTIIQIDVGAGVLWDEYHEVMGKALKEISAVDHSVYIVLNLMSSMPPGNPLPHLRRNIEEITSVPNMHSVMIVGKNRVTTFAQHVINLLVPLYVRRWQPRDYFFDTIEEALDAIRRLREQDSD